MQTVSAHPSGRPPASGYVLSNADTSRLDRWLGEQENGPRFISLTPDLLKRMKAEEILKITMSNLAILGSEEARQIVSLLPKAHKLRVPKAMKPRALPTMPYLGACKIGEVIRGQDGDRFHVTQMFMSNFVSEISPAPNGDIFRNVKKEIGNTTKMFYALDLICDNTGRALGFDRSTGKNGLSFQTQNKADAVWEIAAAATGQTVEALRAKLP